MTTPRIEEMKGRKIGEDEYTEHWSLDGHSYIQVPKWVITQSHQAGRDEALGDMGERIWEESRKKEFESDVDDLPNLIEGERYIHMGDLANVINDTIKALQDNK